MKIDISTYSEFMGFPHKRITTAWFILTNWILGYFAFILKLGILKSSRKCGLVDRF